MKHPWANPDSDAGSRPITCNLCGAIKTEINKDAECPAPTPRARPGSVFDDLAAVGQRLQQIRKEEGRSYE